MRAIEARSKNVRRFLGQLGLFFLVCACIPDGRDLPIKPPYDQDDAGTSTSMDVNIDLPDVPRNVGVDVGTTLDASINDAGISPDTGSDDCPPGLICIDSYPFEHSFSTSDRDSNFDTYSCAPSTDESGPEVVYMLTIEQAGFLSVAIYDDANVDVDVHILSTLDPQN